MATIAEILDLLAAELSVFDWSPDADGVFGTILHNGFQVRFSPIMDSQTLLAEAVVANKVAEDDKITQEALHSLLENNFYNATTMSGSVSYLFDSDELVYEEIIQPQELSENDVETWLETFLQNAHLISSQIKSNTSTQLPSPHI